MITLITGGAGFIGSNLADGLLSLGKKVICLDNFDDFYDPAIKRRNILSSLSNSSYYLEEVDICRSKQLEAVFKKYPIDIVIHLAARAGVRPSLFNPGLYYNINLIGTLNLLEAMRKNNVRKMIFASSSSVYGNNKKIPYSESDPVDNPISPYAASKKASELLCHTYYHLYGFDIIGLRFFTVYGPRQRPEMAITQFVRKIIKAEPIQLFGDGSSQRDYTYIDDSTQGIQASIRNLKGFEIINLGESKTIRLINLIKEIEKLLGKKAIIKWMPNQPGDVDITYSDISKARRLLGYEPCFPLQKGLELFINWYIKNNS